MKRRYKRRKLTSFESMDDDQKQKVVDYINKKEVSIHQASIDLNMTAATINKIYEEKFGKKDREVFQSIQEMKSIINQSINK
mgnify:CR=1 FL=1